MNPPLLEASRGDTRSFLLDCPLFSSLGDAALSALSDRVEPRSAAQGEVLFRQGDRGEELYIIASGSVRLSATDESDYERPVGLLGPRSTLGELALIDGEPRSVTATAARACQLLRVSALDLDVVFRTHPGSREEFLRQGVRLVCSRLRSANERYWSLAGGSFKSRAETAQSRSRLLSLVSHEFRTPLTVIKCSAQLLERPGPVPRASLVQKILNQSARLEVLLDDLITLALLQAGAGVLEMTEFDLGGTAAEVTREMTKAAEGKGLALRLGSVEPESTLVADPVLVRRAVRHLVDNAVRFSTGPGEILVSTEAAGRGRLRLSVRDQGQGIDRASFERLRESFVQHQDPLNRDADGLGIGLALVNEVARAHGGTLSMESTPGAGSCFTIELGRVPESPPSVSASQERKVQDG